MRRNVTATNIIARDAQEDTELAGVYIPKGTRITVDIMEIHRNNKVWDNPEVFDPERFAPGGEAEKVAKMGMSFLPFSNGQRQCKLISYFINFICNVYVITSKPVN